MTDITRRLAADAASLAWRPPGDPDFPPEARDLDCLIFAAVSEVLPERRVVETAHGPAFVDLIWLPDAWLDRPDTLARNGMLAHRIATSRIALDPKGRLARAAGDVTAAMARPEVQSARIAGLLDMGFLTVREVGVTRGFPGLALFWLQIARTACVAAACDALGILCPNVYTRPHAYLAPIEAADPGFADAFGDGLRGDVDPAPLIAAVERLQDEAARACAEPEWFDGMRAATRYEYRYFAARDETAWRMAVVRGLMARGEREAALFALRFWAYALACLPTVTARNREHMDVSYLRPARNVRTDVLAEAPGMLGDLDAVLGNDAGPEAIGPAVARTQDLAARTRALISRHGIVLPDAPPWVPHAAPGVAA